MYSRVIDLGLSKPNIWLEISFWLILIIYTGIIISQTKKGYWNKIKELNFPTRKLKIYIDWIYKNLLEIEILI